MTTSTSPTSRACSGRWRGGRSRTATSRSLGRPTDLDPSAAPVAASFTERSYPDGLGGSQILIDATMNWAYPPVSLPTRQHMEHARTIWEKELGLPALNPRVPWFGYDVGYWPESWDRATKRAVAGRCLETGEEFRALRT